MGTTIVALGILRHNERTKLAAASLEKLSVAILVAGYIAPVVNGTLTGTVRDGVTLFWGACALAMWSSAYYILGRLR